MSIFHVTAIGTLLLLMLVLLIIPVYLTSNYLISYRSYSELSGFKIELQPVLLYHINKIVDFAYTCTIPDVDLLTATTNKLHYYTYYYYFICRHYNHYYQCCGHQNYKYTTTRTLRGGTSIIIWFIPLFQGVFTSKKYTACFLVGNNQSYGTLSFPEIFLCRPWLKIITYLYCY